MRDKILVWNKGERSNGACCDGQEERQWEQKRFWKVEVGDIDHDFTLGGISNWGSIGFGGHEPCEGAMHK